MSKVWRVVYIVMMVFSYLGLLMILMGWSEPALWIRLTHAGAAAFSYGLVAAWALRGGW